MADFGHDERVAGAAREHLPLGPAILFPLGEPGDVRGVFTVGREPGAMPLPPQAIEMISTFAAQAAIGLELAEHRSDAERLAILQDRDRIARDLHDLVIQRLYATGMSLQGAVPLLTRPEAASRVSNAVDALDETIREIRSAIFSLQARGDSRAHGLRAQVLEVADEMSAPLGFAPSLRLVGPLDETVPTEVGEHLLGALREALSNAARHAHASRVDVTVQADTELALRVRDNGAGMGAQHAAQRPGQPGRAGHRTRRQAGDQPRPKAAAPSSTGGCPCSPGGDPPGPPARHRSAGTRLRRAPPRQTVSGGELPVPSPCSSKTRAA